MASAPQASELPLLYKDLVPLNTNDHAKWKINPQAENNFLLGQHAIPLTAEEFILASRHYPIIFSSGDNAVPLALMGMNDGVNAFVDDEGALTRAIYVPAYVRRYPYILARLRPDSEELSLCFDPTSDQLGAKGKGEALFDGTEPTEVTKGILKFCEEFETAGARTQAFVDDLNKLGLLMDGEVAIQQEGSEQPFVYRGFRMVDENKLRELRGDELRKMTQSGMLALIYAHLFSLQLVREVFAMQVEQGKMPGVLPTPAA